MELLDVAVIVPVWNRADIVTDTLDSVAAQTRPPRCLVVVDDGSTDETANVVQKWIATKQPAFEVKLVAQENRGAAAARNRGLRASGKTKYVAFLDSDDLWPKDFLARTVPLLETKKDAVAALTNVTWTFPRTFRQKATMLFRRLLMYTGFKYLFRPYLRKKLHRSHEYLPLNPIGWFLQHAVDVNCCSVLRRSAVDAIGGFDESMRRQEDAPFYMSLSLLGKWVFAPGRRVVIRPEIGERPVMPDDTFHWVQEYEKFITQNDVTPYISLSDLQAVMARKWSMAGNTYAKFQLWSEASRCYQQALRYDPHATETTQKLDVVLAAAKR